MSKRHEKIGIKQTIQIHWMDYVVNLMIAGHPENKIRNELDEYLSTQKQSGGFGERGKATYPMAKSTLASWFSPNKDLTAFRDHAFNFIRKESVENWLPFHWAVISASYPFWFNVAKQTGRLFNLQEKITKSQILNRIKEHYGDRETVERYTRYVIRSFVAWGVLQDSNQKGCYVLGKKKIMCNQNQTLVLFESALHADKDGTSDMLVLKNNPAFFPFHLSSLTSDFISLNSGTIDSFKIGLDSELLQLK